MATRTTLAALSISQPNRRLSRLSTHQAQTARPAYNSVLRMASGRPVAVPLTGITFEPMPLAAAEDRSRIQVERVIASSGQIDIPAITLDVGLVPHDIGQMLRLGRQWLVGVLRVEGYLV